MNHSELIKAAQSLGYDSITDGGLCQGFSMMWSQAVCANDLDSFKARLDLLDKYKSDHKGLAAKIDLIKNKCKNSDYKPTTEEQKFLEILAFFDGVALYLSPLLNGEVFDNFSINQSEIELISKFTAPKGYDGIKKAFSTTDQYTKQDLTQFLNKLEKKLEGKTDSAISFRSGKHSVSARYLGKGEFEYIDTNSNVNGNMTHWKGDAKGLTDQLFSSLNESKNDQYLSVNTVILMPQNGLEMDFEDCRNNGKITQLHHNSSGLTALHIAVREHDMAMIHRFDFNKININQVNSLGCPMPIFAILYKSKDVYKFILDQKQTDINASVPMGRGVLNMLIRIGDFDTFNDLLNDKRLKLPHNPPWLLFDLMCSNSGQAYDVTKNLLEVKQISANPKKDKYWSPLHIACSEDKENMAALLLAHGANINVRDEQGNTPAHVSAERGTGKLMDQLIQNKADFNLKDNKGRTAFDVAIQSKHMDIALKLLPKTNLDIENFGKHWSLKSMDCTPQMKKNIVRKGLEDYIKNRGADSEYRNVLRLGYSKEEKLDAANALLEHLDNPKKEPSPQQTKILKDGRLSQLFGQYQDIKQDITQDHIEKSTQSINTTNAFKQEVRELRQQESIEINLPTENTKSSNHQPN